MNGRPCMEKKEIWPMTEHKQFMMREDFGGDPNSWPAGRHRGSMGSVLTIHVVLVAKFKKPGNTHKLHISRLFRKMERSGINWVSFSLIHGCLHGVVARSSL